MPWTIPDKGEGQNDIQSILFQEALDVLVAGINGVDCVLSGGVVTQTAAGANMFVDITKIAFLTNSVLRGSPGGNLGAFNTADATNPRIDLVVGQADGSLVIRTGTAAAAPKPPAKTANDVVLAAIYIPAGDTTISNAQITDMRVLRTQGPIVIAKVTSPVTFNNTAAIQTYFSLVVPNGLLLSGKIIRVALGGNLLHNSGTPTVTLTIAYGGTTLYAAASGAATADADRGAWHVHFDLVAQANNDQTLVAVRDMYVGAQTAPTTGFGFLSQQAGSTATGAAAVDSDSANRTLTVQFTMSVANAANEIVMEYATAELL